MRTGVEREERLHRQRCVRCGFVSAELQATRTSDGTLVASSHLRCPRCDQDLYTRPARSYAEMEGIVAASSPPRQPPPRRVVRGVVPAGPETDNEVLIASDPRARKRASHRPPMRGWVIAVVACVTMAAVVAAFAAF